MSQITIALVLTVDELGELNEAAADRLAIYSGRTHRIRWPALSEAKLKVESALTEGLLKRSVTHAAMPQM